MVTMDTKQYLGQLNNIDRRIKDKLEEAEKWKAIAMSTGNANYEEKVQSSPKYQKMADAVTLAVSFEEESKEKAKELTVLKDKIIKQIDGIENELYYNILKSMYINDCDLSKIGYQEGYGYKQIKRHYERAIICFGEKYGYETKFSKRSPQKSKEVHI